MSNCRANEETPHLPKCSPIALLPDTHLKKLCVNFFFPAHSSDDLNFQLRCKCANGLVCLLCKDGAVRWEQIRFR